MICWFKMYWTSVLHSSCGWSCLNVHPCCSSLNYANHKHDLQAFFIFRISVYAIIYCQYREPSKEVNESEHPVSIPAVGACPRRRPEGRQRWSSGLGLASSSSSSCTVAASTASVNLRPALQQSHRAKSGNCRIERQILDIQKLKGIKEITLSHWNQFSPKKGN